MMRPAVDGRATLVPLSVTASRRLEIALTLSSSRADTRATLSEMARINDPLDERDDSPSRITPVTRRAIFDYLRTDGGPWWGRVDEISFLDRLYGLDELPTTDYRVGQFPNARADIHQHRFNNEDWPDDWVFSDSRFDLASGLDEVLLGFLAQVAHPIVQPDAERASEIVGEVDQMLAPDGWMLKPQGQMTGRAVYAPARTSTGATPALSFAHEVVTRVDAEHISQQTDGRRRRH
jgi:hypothetical protein